MGQEGTFFRPNWQEPRRRSPRRTKKEPPRFSQPPRTDLFFLGFILGFLGFLVRKIIVFFLGFFSRAEKFQVFFQGFGKARRRRNFLILEHKIVGNPFKIHYFYQCLVPRSSKNSRLRRAVDQMAFYSDPYMRLTDIWQKKYRSILRTFFSRFYSRFFSRVFSRFFTQNPESEKKGSDRCKDTIIIME